MGNRGIDVPNQYALTPRHHWIKNLGDTNNKILTLNGD